MTTQKQSALQTIEEKKSLIAGIADKVWEFAELSLQEFKSAETYCEALEKEGFDVERGTCNIETAFAASYGHGRPYIGILTMLSQDFLRKVALSSVKKKTLVEMVMDADIIFLVQVRLQLLLESRHIWNRMMFLVQ